MKKIRDKKFETNYKIKDKEPLSALLHFSFKYFDTSNNKFSIKGCEVQYFVKLLERLKDICSISLNNFFQLHSSQSLRAHQITWEDTTEPKGFPCFKNNEQLMGSSPYQFEISAKRDETLPKSVIKRKIIQMKRDK